MWISGILVHCWQESKMVQPPRKNSMLGPQTIRIILQSSNSTSGYIVSKNRKQDLQRGILTPMFTTATR